jgi:hypothetical protein
MNRSYLRIDKRGSQLGLDLVNPEGDTFFLYGMPLMSLWENRNSYVLVKHRNRDESQAIAYHAGQVLGALELDGNRARLELYFGPGGQDLEYEATSKTIKKVVARQVYVLPVAELEAVVAAFKVHRHNRPHFDEMTTVGRTLALFEK